MKLLARAGANLVAFCLAALAMLLAGCVLIEYVKPTSRAVRVAPRALSACTRYASPAVPPAGQAAGSGLNNGLTTSTPYRPTDFWASATAGSVLCLMDGT